MGTARADRQWCDGAENPKNGPRVVSVFVTNNQDYPLFDPMPSIDGPTPLVHSLTIRLQDLGMPQLPPLVGDYNNDMHG